MSGLYVAISPHGFGHTTRTCSIVAVVQELMPHLPITIATTAPPWLIDSYLTKPYTYRPVVLDVGVVQADGLQMDKQKTLVQLEELMARQKAVIKAEEEYIRAQEIGLVFADMPPLATEIARSGGIPCWVSSNFGWDLIYREWLQELPQFRAVVDWIEHLYGQADLLLRLPFCEAMGAFKQKIDVGLTGGTPKFTAQKLSQKLEIDPDRSLVLLSFGGLGLQSIPYPNMAKFPHLQFLSFDRDAPKLDNLKLLCGQDLRPVDVMPLCHSVITKPGYSTIAEACRLGLKITCLTRSGFAEGAYLTQGVQNYMHHQIISPEEFYGGDWDFLSAPFAQPLLEDKLDTRGESTIGRKIADFFC